MKARKKGEKKEKDTKQHKMSSPTLILAFALPLSLSLSMCVWHFFCLGKKKPRLLSCTHPIIVLRSSSLYCTIILQALLYSFTSLHSIPLLRERRSPPFVAPPLLYHFPSSIIHHHRLFANNFTSSISSSSSSLLLTDWSLSLSTQNKKLSNTKNIKKKPQKPQKNNRLQRRESLFEATRRSLSPSPSHLLSRSLLHFHLTLLTTTRTAAAYSCSFKHLFHLSINAFQTRQQLFVRLSPPICVLLSLLNVVCVCWCLY